MPNAPGRSFNLMLMVIAALNFAPHLSEHPMVILFVTIPCLLWRGLCEYQKVRLPSLPIKFLLICLATMFVKFNYNALLGVEPATALLICAIALKLVDNVQYRDAMVILFLNFLLMMAKFIASQTLTMTLFAVFNLVMITGLLFQLHKGKDLKFDLVSLIRNGVRLFLQTTPLLILLFFVFPRFSAGFFGISSQGEASTGFSDNLKPGEIGRLVKSGGIAFRAKFNDNLPAREDRYWRGEVLPINKGMAWSKTLTKGKMFRKTILPANAIQIKQEITLEPKYNKWFFALDTPAVIKFSDEKKQRLIRKYPGNIFKSLKNLNQRVLYSATSTGTPVTPLSRVKRDFYLAGTKNASSKVKELVASLTRKDSSTVEKVNATLSHFSRNYKYTLEPTPLSKSNAIDDFLFNKKVGFCEHFAASFAYLMRLSGVPSRVVVGFQGGEPNSLIEGLLTIKDSDAHAWAEVYSDEKQQWMRADPTGVVAPLRIGLGGQVYHSFSEDELQAGMSRGDVESLYESSWVRRYFGEALLYADLAAIQWANFLMKYDQNGQKNLLKRLGLNFLDKTWLGTISLILLVIFFIFWRYHTLSKKPKLSFEQKQFVRLQNSLEKYGLVKSAHEAVGDYLDRVFEKFNFVEIKQVKRLYIQGRYGPNGLTEGEQALLNQKVNSTRTQLKEER